MADRSVLFVATASVLGGAERILLDYARRLEDPVTVACPPGPLAHAAAAAGLSVVPLALRPARLRGGAATRVRAVTGLLGLGRETRALARRERFGLVVLWGMRALLAGAPALAPRRRRPALLFHHHDLLPGPAVGRAVRAASRRCDGVVALSEAIARDLGGEAAILHAGVDLGAFAPSPFPAGSHALLLGAIVPWKRPDLALEAVALAAREVPELRLTVAGAPLDARGERMLVTLRRRAAAPDLAGRVRFAGRIDDAAGALGAAGCLLHCADAEPYGRVLVEALACARPVVAPAAGGPLEIVDASCGLLFAPGDPRGAADALVAVLSEPRRAAAMGAAARRRAEARFDIRDSARAFAALLDEARLSRYQKSPS